MSTALKKLEDDDASRQRFLDLYAKGAPVGLPKLEQLCEITHEQYLEWLDDPQFMKEMEALQTKIFFMAKDQVVRNIGLICQKLVISATHDDVGSSQQLKAAELLLKMTGLVTANVGGKTSVTINNTSVENQTNLKGMSIEELSGKREELAKILKSFAVEPAEFEETTS